ncbi:MAG: helix-hairpin-helix domain-containing protein [Bacteroidales bacterium]|nr:helix-hairpin-helix domain-containing protein [Bacteroidales bacterium]
MKRLFFTIAAVFIVFMSKAQIAVDTLSADALNALLIEQVERLAEDSDDDLDYEDLLENYIFLSDNPVNLNSDEVARLLELHLINAFQYEELQKYRRHYGDFLFMEELEMVEGIDEQTFAILAPVVYVGKDLTKDKVTLKKLARYGKHQLLGRYEQVLEPQQGYSSYSDEEILAKPNSRFLGSPQRYQLRYTYNYRNKVRAGFVLEKDPGEMFFTDHVSDTVKALLGKQYHRGFDFVGFHLYAKDMGIVKAAVVGDYQMSWGQGLTMWSGMSFGKAGAGSSIMKQGRGLSPKSSASETLFMRGTAVTLGGGPFGATVFYANRMIDANVSVADSLEEAEMVSSLQETGYHRTIGEIQDRHAIRQQVVGGHLAYAVAHFEVGYTLHHTWLNVPLQLKPSHYNQYYFQGNRLTNQGLDLKYVKGKYALFGEAAMSYNNDTMVKQQTQRPIAFAGLIGMTVKPTGYLNFTILYRNYGKAYQNLFSNAFGEGGRNQGQNGVYLGIEVAPAPYWNFLAYADQFRFTWLTSQVNAPSWGHDYYMRLSHSFSKKTSAYLQFRSKTKMKNSTDGMAFSHYPIFYTKNSVRFNISYGFNDFVFGNKVEGAHYRNDDGSNAYGYYLCQDIAYKPEGKPFNLTFRYALFDAQDYNARVYAYENDVLYAFSVPALYGKGMRVYLLGKLKFLDALTLYARIGCTFYTDRQTISSGPTQIEGNHKTDLKVEVVWKL